MIDQQHVELWADRNPIMTRVERVTFFEDRAEVVRRARCEVPSGCSWVTLTGVGVFVDDPSVMVRVSGDGVRTLATRVLRHMRHVAKAGPEEIAALQTDQRRAMQQRRSAQLAVDRAERARARIDALLGAWGKGMKRLPSGEQDGMAQWRASFDALAEQLVASVREASQFGQQVQAAEREEKRAQLRLDLAKTKEPDYQAVIEVQIEAKQAQHVDLEVVYRTPCALWRPEHIARLVPHPDSTYELEVRTLATVWQATGERWENVVCKFSTARPVHSASPPLLEQDLLTSRRKTELERRQVLVEQRDEKLATIGTQRGARQVEDMPGVDDGGEPVSFEASRPWSIASDGQPTRVELHKRTMACELDRIAYPERSQAVHFRATATLDGETPLLAGPLWVARGSVVVGRSKTDFVGQGEPFELGIGVDDGLRVRRTFEEKRETIPVIGTQRILRKVRLFVSNLSAEQRSIHVVERFPVSEIEDVKVDVLSRREGRINGKDGFVHYDVELPSHGEKELVFEYRVEAGSRVVI